MRKYLIAVAVAQRAGVGEAEQEVGEIEAGAGGSDAVDESAVLAPVKVNWPRALGSLARLICWRR